MTVNIFLIFAFYTIGHSISRIRKNRQPIGSLAIACTMAGAVAFHFLDFKYLTGACLITCVVISIALGIYEAQWKIKNKGK